MLLNILQYTRSPPTTRSELVQRVASAKSEKGCIGDLIVKQNGELPLKGAAFLGANSPSHQLCRSLCLLLPPPSSPSPSPAKLQTLPYHPHLLPRTKYKQELIISLLRTFPSLLFIIVKNTALLLLTGEHHCPSSRIPPPADTLCLLSSLPRLCSASPFRQNSFFYISFLVMRLKLLYTHPYLIVQKMSLMRN